MRPSVSEIDRSLHYGRAAKLLHWIVAALVFVVLPLGLVISSVRDDSKLGFYMFHESLGFLIFWVMLVRLAVRLIVPAPAMLATSIVERRMAQTVHGLLYACLILMPVTGFLATNAFGFPLTWFWTIPIWSPLGKSPEFARQLMAMHAFLGWSIIVLAGLHLCGVLYHRLVKRDATLARMT